MDSLYSYGMNINNDSDLVKDTIHDLFIDLYKYKKKLRKVENIESYLFTSFKHKLYKAIKVETKVIKVSFNTNDHATDVVSQDHKIINLEQYNYDLEMLSNAMHKLSDKQRKVIQFKFHHGKDYPEIAHIMGISVPSARTQVYRALKTLKAGIS